MKIGTIISLAGLAAVVFSGMVGVVMYVATMRGDIDALRDEAGVQRSILKGQILSDLASCEVLVSKLQAELRAAQ